MFAEVPTCEDSLGHTRAVCLQRFVPRFGLTFFFILGSSLALQRMLVGDIPAPPRAWLIGSAILVHGPICCYIFQSDGQL